MTVDTLRADALGFMGNREVETPLLDRLAAAGRVFEFAHAHNVVTLPSHANILTGLYPYQHGIRDNTGFALPGSIPTLATLLRSAGYRTAAFVAAYPLDARYGLNRGFEVYDDAYPRATLETPFVMPERPGPEVVAAAKAWWDRHRRERRFLWIHLFEPHAPYEPPEPFASRFSANPYLGEVAAVDGILRPLLEAHVEGREPPTVVAVTSDHGEGLGEKGELTHGLFCYEATLRVPLVLWGPGVPPGRDSRSAGHVDLLPTLARLLGVEAPGNLPGRDLLEDRPAGGPPRTLYFEALSAALNRGWAPLFGVLQERVKWIDLPLPELYDLARDPREDRNLASSERARAAELRSRVPQEARSVGAVSRASDEELARLRSLGYVGGSEPLRQRYGPEDDPKRLAELDRKIFEFAERFGQGDFESARKLAEEMIEMRPEMALAHEHLALVHRQRGDLGSAVRVLQAAWKRGLRQGMIARQLGLALAELGRAREAVPVLEEAARREEEIDTGNALAVALYESGDLEGARRWLDATLARDPRNVRALEVLGAVALREGRVEEAREALERALEIDERLPVVWNTLGVARHASGDAAGALEAWQRAVALDSRQHDALFNAGLVALELGDARLAREALGRFLQTESARRDRAARARVEQLLRQLEGTR